MSTAGQYNYKGINAQSWAAMSLFLQYLRDPNFSLIELEALNFEDFNLVFSNGKKIICESKDRKEKFSYPHLKALLEDIHKKGPLNEEDEILVICREIKEEFVSNVRNVKYFDQPKEKFIKKHYSPQLISLLPRVKFWVVPASINEEIIYSLMSELIDFWLPEEDIRWFTDSILIQRIYKGSANGATYSQTEIITEIEEFKKKVQKESDYFNLKTKKEQQFKKLESILKSKGKITSGSRSVSAFSTRWDLMSFAMDRLRSRSNLDLRKWDDLWKLNKVYYFGFGIFHVFENNLQTEKNRKYILSYVKKYTKTIRGFYRRDYFYINVVNIITKIIIGSDGKQYLLDAFDIVKDLINFNEEDFFT
jgi:hypothetical protein